MSVHNIFLPSLNNLNLIRDKFNSHFSIEQIWTPDKPIGAFLRFKDALHSAVALLCIRTGINIHQLNKPIIFRISIDVTVKGSDSIEVYILTAFESNSDKCYNEKNAVLFGVIFTEEEYNKLNYYFQELHKEINDFIQEPIPIIRDVFNVEFDTKVVLCCDYKTLRIFAGQKTVAAPDNCLYCLAEKKDFINYKSYFDSQIDNRLLRSFSQEIGLENDPIIKLERFEDFSIDTLHLKIRLSEKFFNAFFLTLLSNGFYKDIDTIIEICKTVRKNHNINGSICCDNKLPKYPKIILCTKGDKDYRNEVIDCLNDFFVNDLKDKWAPVSELLEFLEGKTNLVLYSIPKMILKVLY